MSWRVWIICVATAVSGLPLLAWGRNVDVSTVPNRDTVELTIYNSEDLTLVQETRKVTFKKGVNPLQFSWANTLIDPTSVELKFLTDPAKLEVLDTTFPHDKPQMLYWNVQSDFDGEATIQISYFTSGITWSADYVGIADAGETHLSVDGYVRIYNRSGEAYENAHIRLVVGTINLVEKIAELAHLPVQQLGQLQERDREVFRAAAARSLMQADKAAAAAPAAPLASEKQIIKQGLSEYFIYSIDGTESIPDQWSKRLRSLSVEAAPLKVQYRYRVPEYGDQLVRMYLLTNDRDSKLGATPLPDGAFRVFRDNGHDGLAFLANQTIKYIPIGDKIELNLGVDPNVIFELIQQSASRDNIWMNVNGADLRRRVDDGAAVIEVNSSVVGWDTHQKFAQRIRNYTDKAIDVEIRRTFGGDIGFRSNLKPVLHDFQTVQFQTNVDAGKKIDLTYQLTTHEGSNAKQNHVTLDGGDPR